MWPFSKAPPADPIPAAVVRPADRETQIEGLLARLVSDYEGKRKMARFYSYCIRAGLIVLGGVTTILLGLREFSVVADLDQVIGITTLILSSIVTMMTAWEGFSNTGWRWAHYRTMLSRLYMLRDDYHFAALDPDPKIAGAAAETTFEAVKTLLTDANRAWEEQRFPNIKAGG